jgi:hypothetical protein
MSTATEESQSHTGKSPGTTIADLPTLGKEAVAKIKEKQLEIHFAAVTRDFA